MDEQSSFKKLFKDLHNNNSDVIYAALMIIRKKYVNQPEKMKYMIKTIISYMEHPKLCNTSLSIIANCCLDDNLRQIVIKHGGIKCLLRILKGLVNDEIVNRVCRALANIALVEEGATAIHKLKPVSHIVQFLTNTEDINCQQTAIRTLRILGSSPKTREILVHENGIIPISKLLKSENISVVQSSVKALALLTKCCSIGCAMQIQESDGLSALVDLYGHSDQNISENALTSLENLAGQSVMRQQLARNGVINIFVDVANKAESHKKTESAILALCSCCSDYIERDAIRKANGVKTLLNVLSDDLYEAIHINIITALIALYSESSEFEPFCEADLLSVAVKLLRKFITANKSEHSFNDESQNLPEPHFSKKCLCLRDCCTCNEKKCVSEEVDDIESEKDDKLFNASSSEKSYENQKLVSDENGCDSTLSVSNSNITRFSIHSPSYQGIQCSDMSESSLKIFDIDNSSSSSFSTSHNAASPDRYSFEWNPSSPNSCSSITGPWSPASSSAEEYQTRWSPVLSSRANSTCSSDSENEDCDHSNVGDSEEINLENMAPSNSCISPPVGSEPSDIATDIKEAAHLTSFLKNFKYNLPTSVIDDFETLTSSPKRKYSVAGLEYAPKVEIGLPFSRVKKPKLNTTIFSKTNSCLNKCSKTLNKEEKSIDYFILILLSNISLRLKYNIDSEIAEKINFSVLMDYLSQLPNPDPRAGRILMRLISNYYSFEKLIMCDFVGQICERMNTPHDNEFCTRCSFLDNMKKKLLLTGSMLCESDYGVGTLSHILLTGIPAAQLNSLRAIAKLVHKKDKLYKLLINADGLSILLEFISSKNDQISRSASYSLSMICRSLVERQSVKPRAVYSGLKNSLNKSSHSTCNYKNSNFSVSFIVENSCEIPASREKLCENSLYFRILLEGQFMEKTQTVISMPDVSHQAFLLLLHFLHGCLDAGCSFFHDVSLDMVLELLSLCDRFLLPELQHIVEKHILYMLKTDTAASAYVASKKYNCPLLTHDILHFILCESELDGDNFFHSLKDLIHTLTEEFLDDIKKFVRDKFPGCRDKPLYKRRFNSTSPTVT